jgi:chemotaxis protein MotB
MARKKHGGGGGGGHDGAGGMRWLLTYADMITLLLALFVMLFAMSAVDSAKFQSVAAALSAAFGMPGNPALLNGGGSVGSKPIVFPSSQLQVTRIKDKLAKHILEQRAEPAINLHLNERGLLIRIFTDKVQFARGSATLPKAYRRLLDVIAENLATTPNAVQVSGYTDNTGPGSGKNWDISGMRAVNTVKYLAGRGIAGERLSASAFSEYAPLVPNSDEDHRSMNRRIDIQVMKAPVLDELLHSGQVERPDSVFPPAVAPIQVEGGVNPKPLNF